MMITWEIKECKWHATFFLVLSDMPHFCVMKIVTRIWARKYELVIFFWKENMDWAGKSAFAFIVLFPLSYSISIILNLQYWNMRPSIILSDSLSSSCITINYFEILDMSKFSIMDLYTPVTNYVYLKKSSFL